MTEEWRTIPSFPKYEASSFGKIRRAVDGHTTKAGRVLKQHLMPNGYFGVSIPKETSKKHRVLVHRAVAEAFHGSPESPDHVAAHWNGIKTDNRPINIRWTTQSENLLDRRRHGTAPSGERGTLSKLKEEQVICIRERVANGETQSSLAMDYNVSPYCIYSIVHFLTWRHLS